MAGNCGAQTSVGNLRQYFLPQVSRVGEGEQCLHPALAEAIGYVVDSRRRLVRPKGDSEIGIVRQVLPSVNTVRRSSLTKAEAYLHVDIGKLEKRTREAAANLESEEAARLRDEIRKLEDKQLGLATARPSQPARAEGVPWKPASDSRDNKFRAAHAKAKSRRLSGGPSGPAQAPIPGKFDLPRSES